LVQEWRRRFEFFAFHLHSKKVQPDRCEILLFFRRRQRTICAMLRDSRQLFAPPLSFLRPLLKFLLLTLVLITIYFT
jgi:hypothetical protein